MEHVAKPIGSMYGIMVYLPHLVDFYGKLVGNKYTCPMDPMGKIPVPWMICLHKIHMQAPTQISRELFSVYLNFRGYTFKRSNMESKTNTFKKKLHLQLSTLSSSIFESAFLIFFAWSVLSLYFTNLDFPAFPFPETKKLILGAQNSCEVAS